MEGVLGFFAFIFFGWIFIKLISSIGSSKEKSYKYSQSKYDSTVQAKSYYALAQVELKEKNYFQAIRYYDMAINLDKCCTYYNNRGFAKSESNDLAGAIADYSMAIQLSTNEPIYFNNRAMAYHDQGKNDLACSDWRKAADLGHSTAKDMLAKYCRNGLITSTRDKNFTTQIKHGDKITEKYLAGTEWHMKFLDASIDECDVKFNFDKTITWSDDTNEDSWSLRDNIIKINFNNGYTEYQGTINNNVFSGKAINTNTDSKWRFQATLISEPDKTTTNETKRLPSKTKKSVNRISNNNVKRANWADFNKIIKDNNISTLYHFTDKSNLQSIKTHGALFSWQYCQVNDIPIPQSGGDDLSHSLDRRHGVQNYVRLSFTRNHPMMYLAQTRGRIGNAVILKIDPEVILWKDTNFSNKNATRNDVNIGASLEDFKKIRFKIVKQRNHFDLSEDEKPYYQAEVLVLEKIPIDFITNIDEF